MTKERQGMTGLGVGSCGAAKIGGRGTPGGGAGTKPSLPDIADGVASPEQGFTLKIKKGDQGV